ncbi:hypothetical protein Tco_1398541 [Tanacetum coccineum]
MESAKLTMDSWRRDGFDDGGGVYERLCGSQGDSSRIGENNMGWGTLVIGCFAREGYSLDTMEYGKHALIDERGHNHKGAQRCVIDARWLISCGQFWFRCVVVKVVWEVIETRLAVEAARRFTAISSLAMESAKLTIDSLRRDGFDVGGRVYEGWSG